MLKLYNALDRKISEFKPVGKEVNMYSCGPTVYYYAHIGNLRAYVFMDLLKRTLEFNGYKVNSVMNITDVGHLTSDADEGEDKMAVASKRENKSPWEISKFYTDYFFNAIDKMNIKRPTHVLKATDCINEMIDFVSGLLKNGYAYETSKGIYFSVEKFKEYGRLSGLDINDKLAGARIEVDKEKRHPSDFALWIKAPKEHIMQWPSPWGMGYPGWHIECSAMCRKIFGDNVDIHTGGIDHMPVHHENEIAQNNCLTGKEVVKRWMHVEFLQVNGGKMGKSLGNLYTLEQLEEKGYSPLTYRYFLLNAHYSKKQNFTFEAMDASKTSLNRLYDLVNSNKGKSEKIDESKLAKFENRFIDAINDNLNIPLSISVLWDMLKEMPKNQKVYDMALKFDQIFGLDLGKAVKEDSIPENIQELASKRWEAKLNKDWALADKLRGEISALGYEILDSKTEYKIIKK